MPKFSIKKWRKKAIDLYGKARGLTDTQRYIVTAAVHGKAKPKGTNPTRKPSEKSSPKKRRKTKTTKKKTKRKSGRILGSVGWKGLLAGIAGLTVAKILVRKFLPVGERYSDGVAMTAVGAVGKVAKIGTANLLPAGIIQLGSTFASDLFFGGTQVFGGQGNRGGYDV